MNQIASTLKKSSKIIWGHDESLPEVESTLKLGFKLGQGSFAVVYQGFDKLLHRDVAIKTFDKASIESNPEKRSFLEKEVEILANLPEHHNICEFLRVVQDQKKVQYFNEDILSHGVLWLANASRAHEDLA